MHASQAEKNVFGHNVKLHQVTRMPIEQGHGALSADEQAWSHCDYIEQHHGKKLADAMRAELRGEKQIAAAQAEIAAAEQIIHKE